MTCHCPVLQNRITSIIYIHNGEAKEAASEVGNTVGSSTLADNNIGVSDPCVPMGQLRYQRSTEWE